MAFKHTLSAPADPIFGIQSVFEKDTRPEKINLSIGVFRNEKMQLPILECVKTSEQMILEKQINKAYLPIEGDPYFIDQVGTLLFSDPLWQEIKSKTCGIQTVGGTTALRLGADLLKQEVTSTMALSDPTWPNHFSVFSRAGMESVIYPYYNRKGQRLDIEGMCDTLKHFPQKTAVLFHACCHNPSGADPSFNEWTQLGTICLNGQLIPFFDLAYQGFGDGIEEDAQAVRLFAKQGHDMLIAVSFSKNFSLYGERAGALFIVSQNQNQAEAIKTHVRRMIRGIYSNPPLHAAKIVGSILGTPTLRHQWHEELEEMRKRIITMRSRLAELLTTSTGRDFSFLIAQKGLFSLLSLDLKQIHLLKEKHALYITEDGRINLAGLTPSNLHAVCSALTSVL